MTHAADQREASMQSWPRLGWAVALVIVPPFAFVLLPAFETRESSFLRWFRFAVLVAITIAEWTAVHRLGGLARRGPRWVKVAAVLVLIVAVPLAALLLLFVPVGLGSILYPGARLFGGG